MSGKTDNTESRYNDFSTDEEQQLTRSYLRKIDLRFLPICCAVYCTAIWDRNNEAIIGLHGGQFNWIVSAFFFTYIFCEIPSNIMLKRVGAKIWLPFIAIAWSVLCACMAAGKSYASLIVIRILMGIFEAGLVPGFIFFTSFWYTRRQLGPRISLFFSAGTFAGIWTGPLAAALQKIDTGLHGYQYIFIIEAVITVGLAVIMYFLLQNYPESATFLSEDERSVAMEKLDKERALAGKAKYNSRQVLRALADPTVWGYGVIFWAAATGGATQAIFGPTLDQGHGIHGDPRPGAIISMFLPRLYPRLSVWMMIYSGMACVFYAIIASVSGIHIRFAFLCLANFALSPTMPIVSLWMQHNVLGVTKKGVASAMTVMMGGIAGLIGSHIYRNQDAPQYRFGHLFVCVCNALVFAISLALHVYFRLENRRRDRMPEVDLSQYSAEELEDMCDNRPDHRYSY
ncbi:MFS general substrate transporter [Linderina pennispora]|uniref:MFS general substrate transporter n=1 Tax=Linderina pennispora TaxID=61395 RepID=A0A1Y1VY65_9FUNG|nr:MFS general substrate transporter [Linderina pennispora]ORX66220.1 MFS general substrate transporter [Linderina pennispora]